MSSHKYPASGGGGGSGDVVGGASSDDNAIVRYNGTTGKLIQNSLSTVDDDGNIVMTAQDIPLSDINIVQSTGLTEGGVVTINADPTKFDISAGKGRVLDYYTDPDNPVWTNVTWTAFTAETVTNIATQEKTWVLIDSAENIVQLNTYPTPQERRLYIVVGVLNHVDNVNINDVISNPDYLGSPLSQLNDLVRVIGPFNANGNVISPNGVNLSFDKTVGEYYGAGINYDTSVNNPNLLPSPALSPVTFSRITQTDITVASTTFVDPANYDVGGVVTPVGGGSKQATIQRVYASKLGYYVTYGQNTYANVDAAVLSIPSDSHVLNSSLAGISVLLAYICVEKTATDLSDNVTSEIVLAGRFAGSSSLILGDDTLQSVYNQSTVAETVVNGTLNGISIKDNATPIGAYLFRTANNAGSTNFFIVDVNGFGGNGISANRALISDANSRIKDSVTTSTELSYVNGVTSSIQTQLNGKQPNTLTTRGDLLYMAAGPTLSRLALGGSGQFLGSDGTDIIWANAAGKFTTANIAVASNVTLTDARDHLVDTTSVRTLTLPAPAVGLFLRLKDVTGSAQDNNITINTPGAETIDGAANYVMESNYESVSIISDGTNYFVI